MPAALHQNFATGRRQCAIPAGQTCLATAWAYLLREPDEPDPELEPEPEPEPEPPLCLLPLSRLPSWFMLAFSREPLELELAALCRLPSFLWLWLPARRASSDVNSCAVPFSCAARPPSLAISRCWAGSMEAKPRLLVSLCLLPPLPLLPLLLALLPCCLLSLDVAMMISLINGIRNSANHAILPSRTAREPSS